MIEEEDKIEEKIKEKENTDCRCLICRKIKRIEKEIEIEEFEMEFFARHFDPEDFAQIKLSDSPIRKLSKFYAKASTGRFNSCK